MRKVLGYLIDHIKCEKPISALLVLLVTFLLTFGKYYFDINTYFYGTSLTHWLAKFSFYTIPFFLVVFIFLPKKTRPQVLLKLDFWFLCLIILSVLFVNKYFRFYQGFAESVPRELDYFYYKFGFNLHTAFFYFGLPFLYYCIQYKGTKGFGSAVGFEKSNYRPYLYMIGLMLPLLFIVSFQDDFLRTYPRYRPGDLEVFYNIPYALSLLVYELSYAFQFITLEMFFRGFFIFFLFRYLGNNAVWAMVIVYALLHFEKPMAETVGSIFGGYILGVISLRTRSIWGGVIVHVGIALMMEILAFFQQWDTLLPN